ncbi:hypothetical protein [uncultured Roseibium sp.]|uniref:hypothetical protein n=1 Tax=uncultured Roseibium sp. TaxID=1936171 RepID=UPI0032167596
MVIPLRDDTGRIWSLQFVGDEKLYLKHGRKDGLYHTIDPDRELGKERKQGGKLTVIVGEGYATCADVHKATKLPTIVAFDGDNLVATAKAVRERYPAANILIAADDDHHLPKKTPPLPNKGQKCAWGRGGSRGRQGARPDFYVGGERQWRDRLERFEAAPRRKGSARGSPGVLHPYAAGPDTRRW